MRFATRAKLCDEMLHYRSSPSDRNQQDLELVKACVMQSGSALRLRA